MNSDPEVMRFMLNGLTSEQSNAFIDDEMALIESRGWGLMAAELKASGEFIGFIGAGIPNYETSFTPCIDLRWRLHKHFWGRGLAAEGAKAFLDFAFSRLGFKELVAFTYVLNAPSIRVMEKIGMLRDMQGDFDHPKVPVGHRLRHHVLYRARSE